MDRRAGLLGQHGVPHDHDLLRDGGTAGQPQRPGDPALVHRVVADHVGVLAVGENGESQPLTADHGVPDQIGVLHGHAVVGEGHAPGLLQGRCVGERLPLLSPGHRPDGPHPHAAGLPGPPEHILDLLRRIQHGPGIGHTGYGGESSPGRRRRSGGDVLLIFKARLPQVDVHIHKARAYVEAPGVDHPGLRFPQIASDDGQLAVLDENIHHAADPPHGVHQAALPDEQLHFVAPFPRSFFLLVYIKKGTGSPFPPA